MEIRDLTYEPADGDGNGQTNQASPERSLERANYAPVIRQAADQRVELYTRLRTIIDNATESIRALKEENATLAAENAEMSDHIGLLEHRIRAVTTDLANDEAALRQSAEMLEHVLHSAPEAPARESVARLTPVAPSAPEATSTEPPDALGGAEASETVMPEAESPATVTPDDETAEDAAPEAAMPDAETPQAEMTEDAAPTAEMATEQPAEEAAPEAAMPASEMAHTDTVIAPVAAPATHTDGSYTLIAYPFVRFSDLGQFQAALQKLAGVHDVQVRRFAQGTLEMRIGYTGTTDLATALRSLAAEVEDVQEEEPGRLRVRLRTSQDG